jgi:predicted RNA binding protein YcfA (HicA-like mRNA interferase family)
MPREMTRKNLPLAPGDRHVKAFVRAGWTERKRTAGSHAIMTKDGHPEPLSIPCHKDKDVKRGLLEDLVQLAGMTIEEYCACFKGKRLEKIRAAAAAEAAREKSAEKPPA